MREASKLRLAQAAQIAEDINLLVLKLATKLDTESIILQCDKEPQAAGKLIAILDNLRANDVIDLKYPQHGKFTAISTILKGMYDNK